MFSLIHASARAPNPHDKAALAAAVGDLDALFATLSRTARDAAASPSDKQKQVRLLFIYLFI